MISWPSILISALIAIPVGILTSAIYGLFSRQLRSRNHNSIVRRFTREREEQQFVNYLVRNPHMIPIIRQNYRAKLASIVFRAIWATATAAVFVTLIALVTINIVPTGYATAGSALCLGIFYNYGFYRASAMRDSMRRVTAMLDEYMPVSTDMSDEVWKRFLG